MAMTAKISRYDMGKLYDVYVNTSMLGAFIAEAHKTYPDLTNHELRNVWLAFDIAFSHLVHDETN